MFGYTLSLTRDTFASLLRVSRLCGSFVSRIDASVFSRQHGEAEVREMWESTGPILWGGRGEANYLREQRTMLLHIIGFVIVF